MAETIQMGTILIEGGALLPDSVWFESERCLDGWVLAKHLDHIRLGRNVREAGWTYSWIAGEIQARAFGFDAGKTTRRAIRQILAKLKPKIFNCLQITQVASNHFLGLSCVSVSAHPRHIQDYRVPFLAKLPAV